MIIAPFARGDEEALLITISQVDGYSVKVAMTEEELFRHVLGDKEFERRRRLAYENDTGQTAPEPAEIPKIEEISTSRYINLLNKAAGE